MGRANDGEQKRRPRKRDQEWRQAKVEEEEEEEIDERERKKERKKEVEQRWKKKLVKARANGVESGRQARLVGRRSPRCRPEETRRKKEIRESRRLLGGRNGEEQESGRIKGYGRAWKRKDVVGN